MRESELRSKEKLKNMIQRLVTPSQDDLDLFMREIRIIEKNKNEFIVRPGEVPEYFYFTCEGICQKVVKDSSGVRHTVGFYLEGDAISDLRELYSEDPFDGWIQALTKSQIGIIPMKRLSQLYASSQTWERLGRLLNQALMLSLTDRTVDMQLSTAKEKYERFVERYPSILKQVPLGTIASYLGINQATLSRIRSLSRTHDQR